MPRLSSCQRTNTAASRQVALNDYEIKLGKDKFKVFHANMLKVYIDREVSQEAETAEMMAIIEPPDDKDC